MPKQKAELPDETAKLGRERRLETLNRVCNKRRKRLAFWQALNLDDPDARAFVEQLERSLEINGVLIKQLEAHARRKE